MTSMKIILTQEEVNAAIEHYIRETVLWSSNWNTFDVLPAFTQRVMIVRVEPKEVAEEKHV